MGKDRLLGGCSLFLLLLFLLPGDTLATTTPEPQYLVLVPFLIHTETPEKVCVQLSHLNESVTLSITLEHGAQNESLAREVVSEKEAFKCVSFQIPKQSGPPEALLTVLVKGPTLQFWKRKSVLVKNLRSLVFVQTDKPIYKPGQKVQFRIVSLSEDFHPLNEQLPLVYIQDPKRNRLGQWRDVALQGGLIQLSFPLSSEPAQGTYKVVVQTTSARNIERTFNVEEYVLPRFEVSVKAPKIITIEHQELKVTVCAVYTYGKPVPGQVNIHVCRAYSDFNTYRGHCRARNPESICEDFSGQADVHGCLSQVVKTKIFQLKRAGYAMNLQVTGTVSEEGTGVELAGSGSVELTATLSKVTFERLDSYYKPGIPLFGQVKLVDGTKAPIANETIQIQAGPSGQRTSYTTDEQGLVNFSIDTTNITTDSINVQANYRLEDTCYERNWVQPFYQQGFRSAARFYSPSQSYIHIQPVPETLRCGQTQPVQVHYILKPSVVKEEKVTFSYLVLAKGGIVQTGTHSLPQSLHFSTKGVFSLDLSVDSNSAPLARLLLYTVLPSGELVAHSADFKVENCFRNKVKVWFSGSEGLPGSETRLHLSAVEGSLCAIHAVDKSVFLLKPEAELSPQTVYDLLPVKNLRGYHYESHNLDEPNIDRCVTLKNMVVDGVVYSPVPFPYGEGDTYSVLKDLGLKVFTSTKIHKPEICQSYVPRVEYAGRGGYVSMPMAYRDPIAAPAVAASLAGDGGHSDAIQETIRTFFPETWLWKLQRVEAPEVEVPVTIPDTITEWRTGAFCLSGEAGFGISESVPLTAFQPFFLGLTLPYSVVRGEAFILRATLFSYLQSCIRVHLSLAPSPDFEASPVGEVEESYCLCENGRQTVSWQVTPKSLGEVNFTASAEALQSPALCGNEIVETPQQGQKDTVIKSLLVEPEGVEKEAVFNSLLCAKEQAQSAPVSLKLPGNVVEGSARASFCVLGDLLGSAMQNLHQLLQLPYGCGEQNMALLAPNIYILNYLNKTGQLSEEVRSRAIGYLTTGYQQQLNYKHADGSYSTFGERQLGRSEPGNSWLTAFVLKTFQGIARYIFVSENHITEAWTALASRQKENGCFQGTGTLLNNALKGGVDDEVALTAYVTIALLEINRPVSNSVVRNGLFCLETAAQAKDTDVYSRALLAYAFSLAGKEDKREELLRTLLAEAVKEEDGSIHWLRSKKQEEATHRPLYRPRAPSAEVELTAYVLLALLSRQPAPSQEELTASSGIVKWLSQQQNPTGGFASTQDTVVALQALTLYSSLTYRPSTAGATVSLRSGDNVLRQFQVDSTNRLLLQCQALPAVPGDYSPEVTGAGCVYLQTTLRYNIQPHEDDTHFALDVRTVPETCTGAKAHRTFDVAINISYTGQRPVSNMAIVDIKMLSGFVPVKTSVRKLEGHNQVKRTEVNLSHVLLYLEQVSNVTQSFSFTVELDVPVQGLKPALVKVYDYYETDEGAVAEYSAPCSTVGSKQGNA
ncbi:alpha-2-macroglobulin-like [Tiliqua scincoides]|uniref:alpha-2-macroglobulin-like n=1 Tax=Tiliqua scincoides TaxID=71010 RepID=UPI00346372DA